MQLPKFSFNISALDGQLNDFENLLSSKDELDEEKDILPFFKKRDHLSAYIASCVFPLPAFDRLKHEFDISGEFRADLVVGDSAKNRYCFIEFEDAKRNSIFKVSNKKRSIVKWARRFEEGHSQVIDWFWKLDDLKGTKTAKSVLGESPKIYGILVIGRDCYLEKPQQERLKWRTENVRINGEAMICLTFDQLYQNLYEGLQIVRNLSSSL